MPIYEYQSEDPRSGGPGSKLSSLCQRLWTPTSDRARSSCEVPSLPPSGA